MQRSFALIFLAALVACSKSKPAMIAAPLDAMPIVDASAPDADAAVLDASVARPDCAEPTKLVQLGTLKTRATFCGDDLCDFDAKNAFEAETLAPTTFPSLALAPVNEAGAGDAGASTKRKPRYDEIAGDMGMILVHENATSSPDDDGWPSVRIENIHTKKVVFRSGGCSAGGFWDWELSEHGKLVICTNNRTGSSFWTLPSGNAIPELSDEGVRLAPNEAYAVTVPVLRWGNGEPSHDAIRWLDLGKTKKSWKKLGRANDAEIDVGNPGPHPNPYDVAFCGEGELFAASEADALTVYRGADAAVLATIPAKKGGLVSFSSSGRYLSQTRGNATTVYRLE